MNALSVPLSTHGISLLLDVRNIHYHGHGAHLVKIWTEYDFLFYGVPETREVMEYFELVSGSGYSDPAKIRPLKVKMRFHRW